MSDGRREWYRKHVLFPGPKLHRPTVFRILPFPLPHKIWASIYVVYINHSMGLLFLSLIRDSPLIGAKSAQTQVQEIIQVDLPWDASSLQETAIQHSPVFLVCNRKCVPYSMRHDCQRKSCCARMRAAKLAARLAQLIPILLVLAASLQG